jgi:metallo-beta-lactamase family protein
VLFVGFQAENTLGRRLIDGEKRVRIFGEDHQVRCEVASLPGFSGHADQNELREYIFRTHARSGGMLRRVYLVHGEPEAAQALAAWITDHIKGLQVIIPKRGDVFDLM